ncbi:MAG: adenylate kinase family protein [Methanomassiliicoccales archaeon]|nr:adenylate kinase family protein [Methanomassiliicoccales archaeon]
MRVALSGTPGTGKTSVGEALARRGHTVVEVNHLAKEKGLLGRRDRRRETREVDTAALDKAISEDERLRGAILVGHLSHLLTVDLIVVLRCRPSVLAIRLADRKYPEAKVKENVEAEALDVVLIEAAETGRPVLEIDTTAMSVDGVVEAMEEILAGEREKYAIGHIDWSEEVLGWF